jgi:hypothetical protein
MGAQFMECGCFLSILVDLERRRFADCPSSHPGQVNTPGTRITSVICLFLSRNFFIVSFNSC